MNIRILPSLLAADFGHLADGALKAEAARADALHLDIMDGHFVPNISMGPDVVRMAKQCVQIPLNVHLMLSYPDAYIETFAEAGASTLFVHIESSCSVADAISRIRDLGVSPGITINPGTNPSSVFEYLSEVDEVLVMTVRPGYGGQSFMNEVVPSIRAIRMEADRCHFHELSIMVDGGINHETGRLCAQEGADAFVAGTFLYKSNDMAQEISHLRSIVEKAYRFNIPNLS